jgi:hypothetical protein
MCGPSSGLATLAECGYSFTDTHDHDSCPSTNSPIYTFQKVYSRRLVVLAMLHPRRPPLHLPHQRHCPRARWPFCRQRTDTPWPLGWSMVSWCRLCTIQCPLPDAEDLSCCACQSQLAHHHDGYPNAKRHMGSHAASFTCQHGLQQVDLQQVPCWRLPRALKSSLGT